ncbi:MAG: peptidylprolyl isomerase [Gemmatimonas sp.]
MKSYRLPVVLTIGASVAFAVACDSGGNPDTAAVAGGATLSAERLGTIIGNSGGLLEKDFARTLAELWVNYQLAGEAAAKGDSITSAADMDYGLWSFIEGTKTKKWGEKLTKEILKPVNTGCDEECLYNKGDIILSARHILISAGDGTVERAPAVSPEQDAIARKKAEAIAAEATPANFNALTAKSDEPGAKDRKGDLGVFNRFNDMDEKFAEGVVATKPGTVSKLVKSSFGYHIIYRPTYAEAKLIPSDKWGALSAHPMMVAESLYLARIDSVAKVKVDKNAPISIRAVARNTLGFANDNGVVAEWTGGTLTKSRLADILNAYPPNVHMKEQILQPQIADSLLVGLVKNLVRQQIMAKQADSAKMMLDTAELNNMHLGFRNNLTTAWTQLGVDPKSLSDSAKSEGDRVKLAATRVDAYFDKLVKNEIGYADIAYPVGRTLQKNYKFTINDAALDKAVEKAKGVRGSADSLKAKQGPPTPGAAPAGPPPDAAPPAAAPPATKPPVKKP